MIPAPPECEFGLHEQITAAYSAAADCCRDAPTDRRLVVVTALIRSIDPRKPCSIASSTNRCVWSSFHAVPYRKIGRLSIASHIDSQFKLSPRIRVADIRIDQELERINVEDVFVNLKGFFVAASTD